eukprot:gene6257-890_t
MSPRVNTNVALARSPTDWGCAAEPERTVMWTLSPAIRREGGSLPARQQRSASPPLWRGQRIGSSAQVAVNMQQRAAAAGSSKQLPTSSRTKQQQAGSSQQAVRSGQQQGGSSKQLPASSEQQR